MQRFSSLPASALFLLACASSLGCSSSSAPPIPLGADRTTGVLDFTALLTDPNVFYNVPYPSDLRLTATGTPDLTGFPEAAGHPVFDGIRQVAMLHPGFPVVPTAYFEFTGPLAVLDSTTVIPAQKSSPILLIDVDPSSNEMGTLIPTVATTPPTDAYVPPNLLAVAARPGFVLHPNRKYAFVVMASLDDANGNALAPAEALTELRMAQTPDGALGPAAKTLYASLWTTLEMAGIDTTQVAAATVFTTGDVVEELADMSTKLVAKYAPLSIDGLRVYTQDGGATQDGYCELSASITYPQFQTGTPPFDTGGLFDYGTDGLPIEQRDEKAPVVITLPKGEMPAAGFPLVVYFHGSGGLSTALVDRGKWVVKSTSPTGSTAGCPYLPPGPTGLPALPNVLENWNCTFGCNTPGVGPTYYTSPFGFAMAGSALPLNPERLLNASETAYLNLNNIAAGHDTFRQGVIEQRLFIQALSTLQIPPSALAGCTGTTLPAGQTAFHFDVQNHLYAMGQSMGGQYTNMVSATEPLIKASVPTGAGGFWGFYILVTTQVPDAAGAVGVIIIGTPAPLTFMHPALQVFETAWEGVDPMVYMPRLGRRPLAGHPVRPVYEPVGQGDSYFPEVTYDSMALAYGHKETGDVIWSSMQDALTLEGLGGLVTYPVKDDLTSEAGGTYTGTIVQYKGDGVYDPHAIYSQLDSVKYQYGCFLSTMLATGNPTVPAPLPLGTTCPQ
jgi:hypothetical protein